MNNSKRFIITMESWCLIGFAVNKFIRQSVRFISLLISFRELRSVYQFIWIIEKSRVDLFEQIDDDEQQQQKQNHLRRQQPQDLQNIRTQKLIDLNSIRAIFILSSFSHSSWHRRFKKSYIWLQYIVTLSLARNWIEEHEKKKPIA